MDTLSPVQKREELDKAMGSLGLSARDSHLLVLIPLLYCAWTEKELAPNERESIQDIAEAHEFAENEASEILADWLDEKPSEEFWQNSFYILGVLLQIDNVGDHQGNLVQMSLQIDFARREWFQQDVVSEPKVKKVLEEISYAVDLGLEEAKQHVSYEALNQFSKKAFRRRQLIDWSWVQGLSLFLSFWFCALFYGQHLLMQHWYPDSYFYFSSAWPNWKFGLLLFVAAPSLPYLAAGVLHGWKGRGPIGSGISLVAFFSLVFFWSFWLTLLLISGRTSYWWLRLLCHFSVTLLAFLFAFVGAKLGERLAD